MEDPLKKRPIGKAGLEVTEIGFGTAPLGAMRDTYGHSVDEATAHATIHAIFDGPVNFMDTSRNYSFGRSEESLQFSDGCAIPRTRVSPWRRFTSLRAVSTMIGVSIPARRSFRINVNRRRRAAVDPGELHRKCSGE
jgi:hypothetical protein